MAPSIASERSTNGLWRTRDGALLIAALLSGAVAWWMIALPVASLSNEAAHRGHFPLTFAHMIGGTGMLALGVLNLYLAARKTRFRLHRRVGQGYLLFGTVGAIVAITITLMPAHKPAGGPVLTNSTVSLLMLGSAWLAFSLLGWRAARNRQFASHGEWMVRSYILVWSFVFCRVASRISDIDTLGNGEAFIWLSWVAPLIVGEIVMQWPKGAKRQRPDDGQAASA